MARRPGRIGVDLYASNFHKWLCAPKGSGFLYAHPDQQGWLESPIVSWGWVEGSDRHRPQSQFVSATSFRAPAIWPRSSARPPRWRTRKPGTGRPCANGVMPWQQRRGRGSPRWPAYRRSRRSKVGMGTAGFARSLVSTDGRRAPARQDRRHIAEMPPYDEYRVEIPVTSWDEKPFIRFSFQGYNTRDDLETLVNALEHLLPEMTPAV